MIIFSIFSHTIQLQLLHTMDTNNNHLLQGRFKKQMFKQQMIQNQKDQLLHGKSQSKLQIHFSCRYNLKINRIYRKPWEEVINSFLKSYLISISGANHHQNDQLKMMKIKGLYLLKMSIQFMKVICSPIMEKRQG